MSKYPFIDDTTISSLSNDEKDLAIYTLMLALDYEQDRRYNGDFWDSDNPDAILARESALCYYTSSGEAADYIKRIKCTVQDTHHEETNSNG